MEALFYLSVVIASWVIAAILGASLAIFAVLVTHLVEWLVGLIPPFKRQARIQGFHLSEEERTK